MVDAIPAHASKTFHGRDVFAPAAAALAGGEPPTGPSHALVGALPWGARRAGHGRVVHIDHFGNLVSDLPAGEAGAAVAIGGHTLAIVETYESVVAGQLLAHVGSAGTIEIAVRGGSAEQLLHARRGLPVVTHTAATGSWR